MTMASTNRCLREDRREPEAGARPPARVARREAGSLELAPPPQPECDCRDALRRILTARDRFLAALGDGSAPFKLPEEDEYLEALSAARSLVARE
jgi:hypothetical protein